MSLPSRVALRSLPTLCLVTAIVLVLAVGAVGVTIATEPASSAGTPVGSPLAESETGSFNESSLVESNTTFIIEIQTNGDAEWTVTERFNVSTDPQRQEFDALAAEFRSEEVNGSSLGFDSFEKAGEFVDTETDRGVAVTGEERTSAVDGDVGELSLSFTWENFARIDGDRLVLDDVYETEHGLWFKGLTASQELVIRSPAGFGFDDANVIPEQGQLVWEGPTEFTNETLQAVLIGNSGETSPGETPTLTPTETPPDGGSSSLGLVGLVVGGVGILGIIVALGVLAVGTERVRTLLSAASVSGGQQTSETVESQAPPDDGPESDDSDADVNLELLSDEERVERLLEQNGGRMKQATIVKETGWSNAKVSQLLSSMEEDGRINKLRIGRENLISFPDEDVTEIGDK